MLSKLVTVVNWRVLKFLAGGEASLSEIARKTKTTKANTFRSLKQMEKWDIVRKNIQGKTNIYRLNLLHPKAREISELIEEDRRDDYNSRLGSIPNMLHSFLSLALKANYGGGRC